MMRPARQEPMGIEIAAVCIGVVDTGRHAVAPVLRPFELDAPDPGLGHVLAHEEAQGGRERELDEIVEALIVPGDREPCAGIGLSVEAEIPAPALLGDEARVTEERHEV